MNWYKKAQQGLLNYPFAKAPQESTQKIPPSSTDPQTGENIYNCNLCKKPMFEEDVKEWYRDREKQGEQFSFPQYNKEAILQGLTEISQYLLPFYNQLQEYIKTSDLESKKNDTYDYGYHSALSGWEVQVPQLPAIANKYPQIQEICNISNIWDYRSNICGYLNIEEISGSTLEKLSDLILNPQEYINNFMDYIPSDKTFSVDYTVPVCEDCFEDMEKCEYCNEPIMPGERKWEVTWNADEYVCESCVENGNMDTCHECGKAEYPDDMTYNESDESFLCENCNRERGSEYKQWAQEAILGLDLPIGKNQPISKKVLNSLEGFMSSYVKKYGDKELTEDEWGRMMFLGKKARLSEDTSKYLDSIKGEVQTTGDILDSVSNNIKAQDYMGEKYPNIKNYTDIPFNVEVVDSYNNSKPGFTITITPKNEFIEYAEKIMPGARGVWDKMRYTPHHSGTLAYARCTYDGESLVITNLQRDADYDNYTGRVGTLSEGRGHEIAKWIDNATKNWDVFLLHLIKSMAIEKDANAFLTTFDHQKEKWGRLPIHKSKRTYEKVPEMMGFPISDNAPSSLTETPTKYDNEMYQVANDSWYKRIVKVAQELKSKEVEGKPSKYYSDIGHNNEIKEDDVDRNYMWVYYKGKILVEEETSLNSTHWGTFPEEQLNGTFSGRYEPSTGRLSVLKPQGIHGFRGVPPWLTRKLRDYFPNITKVYEF
jgi:hypothetical protein